VPTNTSSSPHQKSQPSRFPESSLNNTIRLDFGPSARDDPSSSSFNKPSKTPVQEGPKIPFKQPRRRNKNLYRRPPLGASHPILSLV